MTRLASTPRSRQAPSQIFENRLYTIKDAAAAMEMSHWTLRDWIYKGLLRARRTPGGRSLRIHGADLNAAFDAAEALNPGVPKVRNGAT